MSPCFRPVIRVFVSSTFSDLKEERNVLQSDVFPRLEHSCLVRGFQFQAIDLRWGVPGEAGRDHRTMQICFDERIRRDQPSAVYNVCRDTRNSAASLAFFSPATTLLRISATCTGVKDGLRPL